MILLSSLFIVLITLVVISQAASVSEAIAPYVQDPTDLMTSALDYQNKVNDLQNEIDIKIAGSLTSISTSIKDSRTSTLVDIKENADKILIIHGQTKEELETKLPNDCVEDLLKIHESVTHVTGASFGNCLKAFNKNLLTEIVAVKQLGPNHINGIILEAFNGKNAFKAPEDIKDTFVNIFVQAQQDWTDNQALVEQVVANFQETVDGIRSQFNVCSTLLHDRYVESTKKITEAADEVCGDQDGIAKRAQFQFIRLMALLE